MNEIVIRIEGLEELTKAVQALAAASGVQEPAPVPAATVPEQTPAPLPQVPPLSPGGIVPQPVPQQTVPVQSHVTVPAQYVQPGNPVPTQVPTTAAPQQYSFDQLAVALSNLCANMGKQNEVHNLLNQFGVNALFDLPKEKYGEFAVAMRGIGGVI